MADDDDERRAGEERLEEAGLSRFGGDFSSSRGRERSHCGDHSSNSFRALSSVASAEASVRCDSGAKPKRPGPPYSFAAG